jgi:hypothetical protein
MGQAVQNNGMQSRIQQYLGQITGSGIIAKHGANIIAQYTQCM